LPQDAQNQNENGNESIWRCCNYNYNIHVDSVAIGSVVNIDTTTNLGLGSSDVNSGGTLDGALDGNTDLDTLGKLVLGRTGVLDVGWREGELAVDTSGAAALLDRERRVILSSSRLAVGNESEALQVTSSKYAYQWGGASHSTTIININNIIIINIDDDRCRKKNSCSLQPPQQQPHAVSQTVEEELDWW
jgi:hypothetical protein